MVNWIQKLFGREPELEDTAISIHDYNCGIVEPPPAESGTWAGDKYYGGFGPTQIYDADYWTLRMRSGQLYRENLYLRGLLRRLVTNIINTGIVPEATPNEDILGVVRDSLADWSEDVENKFDIWANNPDLCDVTRQRTFWQIQRDIKLEGIVGGDVLVVLHVSKVTQLPMVQIIDGNSVQNPQDKRGRRIDHGVERDAMGRHLAYWIEQDDGSPTKRIAAWGPKSGRRVAMLVYGNDKRHDEVRGEPMFSVYLQHAKELDRSRDGVLRKADINNMVAMVVTKTEERHGTRPISSGATRKGSVTPVDDINPNRRFTIAEQVPGVVFEELQYGEEITPYSNQGNDVDFGKFESNILAAIAWSCEMPPSILQLAFSSNYSATQGEANEFGMFLSKERSKDAGQCYKIIYSEFFISSVLVGNIKADGFLAAYRDPKQYNAYGAWIASDWCGAIKPTTDPVKQVKAYILKIRNGLITRERASKELTGMKYSKIVRRLKSENEALAEANAPLEAVDEDDLMVEEPSVAALELLQVANDDR